MNNWQQMVHEFHEATNSTVGRDLGIRDNELRAKLIMEEAVETVAAMGFAAYGAIHNTKPNEDGEIEHPFEGETIFSTHKVFKRPDMVEAIDGLCDLIYVIAGSAVAWGVDLEPHFNEVHRANMQKLQGPKRADGKQLKPEGWSPPDHEKVLERTARESEIWKELESKVFSG